VDSTQVLLYQSILTRKVLVEGPLGDLRVFGEPLDPGGMDAVSVEQGSRGGQDPFAGRAAT